MNMASVQSIYPDPQVAPVHSGHPADASAQKRKLMDIPSPPSSNIAQKTPSGEDERVASDESPQSAEDMAISESKRRAQNRAAQRAFRERKERHLKELETRLAELESESRSWKSTNMALRSQLSLLEGELQHYRLPQSQNQNQQPQPQYNGPPQPPPQQNDSSNILPAHMIQSFIPQPHQQPQQYPPVQQQQPQQQYSGQQMHQQQPSPQHPQHQQQPQQPPPPQQQQPSPGSMPGLSYDSPGSGSSVPTKADDFCDKLSTACGTRDRPVPENAPRIASETPSWQQDAMFGVNNFGNNNIADWVRNDGLNAYDNQGMNKMQNSLAGGPAQDPQNAASQAPNTHTPVSSSSSGPSSLPSQQNTTVGTPNENQKYDLTQNAINLDFGNIATGFGPFSLNSMGENNGDGLGFPADINGLLNNDFGVFDPLDDMLVWDPQSKQVSQDDSQRQEAQQPNSPASSNAKSEGSHGTQGTTPLSGTEPVDEQVPVASQKFIPCADVWDRICAHPRFGEIDINSMCQELRNKARCSKTGVVLDEQDVDAVLGSLK